jgi:O-antigen ligase
MNPSVATIIFACGVAALFYLDRDPSARSSRALWLPVAYLWIIGSRPVSAWLGVTPPSGTDVRIEGSPLDAAFFQILLAAAIIVLIGRGKLTRTFLNANWPILIFYSYCFLSISWAYYPDVAFKAWVKAVEDLAMVLVIVTDRQPIAAITRLTSRVGFLLLPASVLFIKYYPDLGRGYTLDGLPMETGVTTNKNSLGQIVLVISLVVLWNVRALLQDKKAPNRTRRLAAQASLLVVGVALLHMANSSTCVACFFLGGGLILATGLRAMKIRPARVHALCLGILLVGALIMLLGGQSIVTGALSRKSNFSGRTDIWSAVISAVSNPIVGDGFENFWIGPDTPKVWRSLSEWWHPEGLNEAHNGYIEVYANLGWIGICLIVVVLISAYRRAVAAYRMNPTIGGLILSYIFISAFFNITESGFRSPQPMSVFLFLAIFSAGAVGAGLIGPEKARIPVPSHGQSCTPDGIDELLPETETAYANWPALGKSDREQS